MGVVILADQLTALPVHFAILQRDRSLVAGLGFPVRAPPLLAISNWAFAPQGPS